MVHPAIYHPSSCPSSCPNEQEAEWCFLGYPKCHHVGKLILHILLFHGKELLCHIKGCTNTLPGAPKCSNLFFKWSLKYCTFILIKLWKYIMDDSLTKDGPGISTAVFAFWFMITVVPTCASLIIAG